MHHHGRVATKAEDDQLPARAASVAYSTLPHLLARAAVGSLGALIVAVCGYYLLADWAALSRAYAAFQHAHDAGRLADVQYYSQVQLCHRLNAFAEGVGVLAGLHLVALALLLKR